MTSPDELAASPSSDSPMDRVYSSPEFQLAWDNELSFHVAQHALHARRFRGKSQAEIGKAMGTSQSAIARIEGGDENITIRTLARLVKALKGRVRFSIQPEELNIPRLPDWWEWEKVATGVVTTNSWDLLGVVTIINGSTQQHLLAGWTAQATLPNNDLLRGRALAS